MTWKEWLNGKDCHKVLEFCVSFIEMQGYAEILGHILTAGDLWSFCDAKAEDWESKHPLRQLLAQKERAVI